jgi:transposase
MERYADRSIKSHRFQFRMVRLRREVRQALEQGSWSGCAKTSASCFEILKLEDGLWTFARVQGIEPTNNAAERALQFAVIWQRISGRTDSQRGSRFVKRMLSVVATCRHQERNVLDYLK